MCVRLHLSRAAAAATDMEVRKSVSRMRDLIYLTEDVEQPILPFRVFPQLVRAPVWLAWLW